MPAPTALQKAEEAPLDNNVQLPVQGKKKILKWIMITVSNLGFRYR